LFVVLAVDVLHLGGSGAGYLNAAFGAGGVIGIAATVVLVGRSRLAPPLAAAALAWSLAFLVLGLWGNTVGAFLLLAVAGTARSLLDVTARTLLQRIASTGVLARVFGLLETLDSVGLALGSLLAPVLVVLLGPQAAVAGLAVVLPALLLIAGRRLKTIDESADVPVVEVALLRSVAIVEPLGAPTLEGLARQLTPVELRAGERVIEEGRPGRRYYVVADGRLEVTRGSESIATVARGGGVGEISLLAGVPCTATVTATGAALLYALDAEPFIEVVTSHPASAEAANHLVRRWMPMGHTAIVAGDPPQ
ncbi:MAG: cyclic nucleotide-binding domain-containing protein, partial [Gammaproteobacteria bacterium]